MIMYVLDDRTFLEKETNDASSHSLSSCNTFSKNKKVAFYIFIYYIVVVFHWIVAQIV